jgi:hypothetical protein
VTVGDDGQVTGHEEAVTAFLEANEYLVGTTPRPVRAAAALAPRSPRPLAGGTRDGGSFGMTPEEYAANK